MQLAWITYPFLWACKVNNDVKLVYRQCQSLRASNTSPQFPRAAAPYQLPASSPGGVKPAVFNIATFKARASQPGDR
jgi:hypothetical protein